MKNLWFLGAFWSLKKTLVKTSSVRLGHLCCVSLGLWAAAIFGAYSLSTHVVTTWLWNYFLPEKLGQNATERHLQGAQMNNVVTVLSRWSHRRGGRRGLFQGRLPQLASHASVSLLTPQNPGRQSQRASEGGRGGQADERESSVLKAEERQVREREHLP